jgi:hypothetical protein
MRNSNRRPNWGILYAIVALFILVFILEAAIPFSETVQRSLEITIALLFYGLVWMWLGINDQALMQEDMQRERRQKQCLLKANAPKPAPGALKKVAAWVIAAALAIYRFLLS